MALPSKLLIARLSPAQAMDATAISRPSGHLTGPLVKLSILESNVLYLV